MTVSAATLLLGDGRLPAGGYAHSGGLEPTVMTQGLTTADDIADFLAGRARSAGFVSATFAAAACRAGHLDDAERLDRLDVELDARTPSQTTRDVSRMLGRQLVRALRSIHSSDALSMLPDAPHQAIAYGVGAASLGLTVQDAAQVVLHEAVAGPASAAVKVVSLDPFAVHAALVALRDLLDRLAAEAAERSDDSPDALPALATPLLDLAAEHHRRLDVRLFAS